MDIRERREDGITVIQLSGRLTVNDQPGQLKSAVMAAVQGGAKHVLLDMAGVPYIDSTRLGELIAAHVTASRQGSRLGLVAVPKRISDLLTLAGLDGVFQCFATAHDASMELGR